ncbi:MAG: YbhN family protein [Dermatophilaceae bacterium]|nr:flippase-like domain-containing protein [Intrasporangiaceae bacterium]
MELGTVRCPPQEVCARRRPEVGIKTSWWRWARPLGGAVILGVLFARLGGGPFVDALLATDAGTLAAAAAIAAVTTACAAWRWRLVAHGLHAELPMVAAVAACYRAQFLNVTLPGGVLGDVDRGVHHGRELDDVGRGLRAVAWERTAGQVVLALVTVAALLLGRPFSSAPPPVPEGWLLVLIGAAVFALVLLAARWAARTGQPGVGGRVARAMAADARSLGHPSRLVRIVLASLAILAGHLATFWLAARTVGMRMPLVELLPLALIVLLVAALPFNVAGWGPREGAAAWAFAGVGAGATQGFAVAVAYGAMVFVAALPGAVLIFVGRSRRSSRSSSHGIPRKVRRGAPPAVGAGEVTLHG